MSCDPFVMSPEGRRGVGVIQPQGGLDYPLVAPSADVRFLVADFYLAYEDPADYDQTQSELKHPLRISWLYGVGCDPVEAPAGAPTPTHAADLQVVDSTGQVVFDSTQANTFSARDWGSNYKLYEWTGLRAECRLLVYTTWPPSFEIEPRDYPTHLAPANAVLDERAVYRMPKRVRTLQVKQGEVLLGSGGPNGVVFRAGNNLVLANTTPSNARLRKTTNVTFTVEPGAGLGKYADCGETLTTGITNINGATPNKYGDIALSASDCLHIRQPTTIDNDGRAAPVRTGGHPTLAIGTDCPPCCDCPDYVELAKYMNRVRNRFSKIGKRAHQVKLLHETNIARWADQRDCRLQRPIKALLVPQYCPVVDVVLMYCNQCQDCAKNVVLSANFSTFPTGGTGEVMCGHSFMFAPDVPGRAVKIEGTWPNFTARFPQIDVGNSAYVKFRLKISPDTYPYALTTTVTGTISGAPIRVGCDPAGDIASATDTQATNCDTDGSTLENC